MQVILDLFTELYEKQDILSKLTQSSSLQGYGYSVIHCLDAIGILDGPNITKIAEHLKMIIIKKRYILNLQLPENIYF